ncbi:MAG: Peptidase family [Bacteroidota bacterium]|jgi:hypothetical protein|nr:Peptidase family [Bacteroidota bacterium]
MIKHYYTGFLLILVFKIFPQQNLKENFSPLKSSGKLPAIFSENIRAVITKDIADIKKAGEKNADLKAQFVTSSNYQIEKIVKSGNSLINGEVSDYLNNIVDVIFKDDPGLRSKISVYAFKSEVVNAYSFDKGYVFVNLGLIAQAETEAQLAYLLCHEIQHYLKNHQINGFVNEQIIESNSSFQNKVLDKCQYSKETEGEADVEGFKLFEKTPYNPKESLKLFDVLQYSHLPFELVEFKKSFFESKNYVLPEKYFLKTVQPISDNSNIDDSKMTHPSTAKRKSVVSEKLKFADKTNKKDFILGEARFEYIRDLARFELCRLYLKNRDYVSALYAGYLLKQKYPDNEFIDEVICKSLYALSLYKNGQLKYNANSHLSAGIPAYTQIEGFPQQLYHLVDTMPSNEFVIMSLNYTYRAHKRHSKNLKMAAVADSLLKMMHQVDWKISDFNRSIKEETILDSSERKNLSKTEIISKMQKIRNKEDSIYYVNVFHDLLTTDKYFSEKFPLTAPATNSKPVSIKTKPGSKQNFNLSIDKALFLEPFYYKIDKDKNAFKYVESDLKQEKLLNNINSYASAQGFELVTLDPALVKEGEIEKLNDYSILNDWLFENLDHLQNNAFIFNTNEIENLIARYGTPYVIKTGMISSKSRLKNRTFFMVYVFDLRNNNVVYSKTEIFRVKDATDLINAKSYQMIYELKNLKKSLR